MNSAWKTVRLGNIGSVVTGNTPKTSVVRNYASKDVSFYKPSDFNEDVKVMLDAETKVSLSALKGARVLPEKAVMVTCIGTIGKIGIATSECISNQQINTIIPNTDIDSKFLAYSLLSNRDRLRSIANAPIVPIINKTSFSNFTIRITNLDKQQEIAGILDKASELVAMRKRQLTELDKLAESVFYDMFGDPVTNPKGWERITLGHVITVLTDYHANGSYVTLHANVKLLTEPNYALMVRTTDLAKSNFNDNCIYIDEKAYEFLSKTKVYGNEIIINKIGSAGKVYLMPILNKPVSLGMNAFLLRLNNTRANYLYVCRLLQSDYGQNEIAKHIKGAVTKTITKEAVRSIRIIAPPIVLQNKFAERIEIIEQQKEQVRKAIKESEDLFQKLMQDMFNPEYHA